MKKLILLIAIACSSSIVMAQIKAVSGSFGILNPKLRLQYEHGIGDQASAGANINIYFVNWKGPRAEGFFRYYFGQDGNEKGLFMQAKGGFGILTNAWDGADLYFDYNGTRYDIFESKTWTTIGGGIAFGGKIVRPSGFVFESHIGYHFWSPPNNYSSDYDSYYGFYTASFANAAEAIGWYLTTGFPLDIQMKFGYQF